MNINRLLKLTGTLLLLGTASAPVLAASAYTPTMKDMMSINLMIHRYMEGLDKHDSKAMAAAFAEDGALMLYDHGKLLTDQRGRSAVEAFVARPPAGGQMPPPGAMPGGPPPGAMPGGPPPGAQMPPGGPPPGGAGAAPPMMKEMFHFIANDYYDFESPTRVKHYAYWMDITPGDGRTSSIGIPGHYEDVFVKRGGEWYILERKIYVGTK